MDPHEEKKWKNKLKSSNSPPPSYHRQHASSRSTPSSSFRNEWKDEKPKYERGVSFSLSKRESGSMFSTQDSRDEPDLKRRHRASSPSSGPPESFAPYSTIGVQLNSWKLDISKMDDVIEKILFKVTLVQNDDRRFELSLGLSAMGGDVNRQTRRRAQCLLFENWFRKNPELFNGQTKSSVAAYDAAETIYIGSRFFSGGFREHICNITEDDFSPDEWKIVNRISRRAGSKFEIRIKCIGQVYTHGPESLTEENRPELTRCLETISNQILHNDNFLLYSSGTYPVDGGVLSAPDELTEIKSGFSKVSKVIKGSDGEPKAVMTIDTAKSAFFKSTSVLNFFTSKLDQLNGRGGGGRGGFGGRGRGFHGDRGRGFHGDRGRGRGFGGSRGGYSGGRDSYRSERDDGDRYRRDSHSGNRDRYDSDRHDGHRRDSYGDRDRHGGDRDRGDHRDSHRRDHNDREREDRHREGSTRKPNQDFDDTVVSKYQKEFQDERISKKDIDFLGHALKGLVCEALHLKDAKANRTVIIDGLHNGTANTVTFSQNREGEKESLISVNEYFFEKYNYRIKYPHLPLIASKRRTRYEFFPMELLFIIPGQRIKISKMSPEIQSHMTGKNTTLPVQHIEQSQRILEEYLKLGDRCRNDHMDAFNVRLKDSRPIRTNAKILAPPYVEFADGHRCTIDPGRGGVRFQDCGKFIRPARIRSVLIINYDSGFHDVDRFALALGGYCQKQGIRLDDRPSQWRIKNTHPDDSNKTKQWMEEALRDKVTVVIGIVSEKRPEIHDVLKYFEEKMGQQTLQLSTETARKMTNGQGGAQTIDNVMRKLNPKCGGTNFFIEVPETVGGKFICENASAIQKKLFKRTQFIGFELSHTGARSKFDIQKVIFEGDPTTVGVCYSLKYSTQLGGFSYFQDCRLHQLSQLNEKLNICLDAYQKCTDMLPENIVVFRVGSGEGDYQQVRKELEEMRTSATKKKSGYEPKFIVILVQRRSHVRIFPGIINGQKAIQQNVASGTCVDDLGSSHGLEEFILTCQTPLIGTVRPTRYTIISNEVGWTTNEVMNMTYQLAFGHQVSYAPPGIPNVLYAASNLAKRGHNNYKTHTKLADIKNYSYTIKEKYENISQEDLENILVGDYIETVSKELNDLTITGRNFWA